MNKTKKILLIGGILTGAGLLLTIIGAMLGGALTGIGIDADGLHVYTLNSIYNKDAESFYREDTVSLDAFTSIAVDMNFGEVRIEESDHFGIDYKIEQRYDFSYKIENGCLKVIQDTRKNFPSIMLFGGSGFLTTFEAQNYITIYVPTGTILQDVSASLDSVNTSIVGIHAGALDLDLDFGNLDITDSAFTDVTLDTDSVNMKLFDFDCSSLTVSNDFGSLEADGLTVQTTADIAMESSNLTFNNASLGSLTFESSFGNVILDKVTIPDMKLVMDSGKIAAHGLTSDKIDITSDFGNVELSLTGTLPEYYYDVTTDFGSITIDGKRLGSSYNTLFDEQRSKTIKVRCDSGEVTIIQE